jgi:hypothetical protein
MKRFARFFHALIYVNLITGFFSALYMIFVVYRPPNGTLGPLWNAVRDPANPIAHEFLIERRLYALEAWVIFGILAIYFALTTPLLRRSEKMSASRD